MPARRAGGRRRRLRGVHAELPGHERSGAPRIDLHVALRVVHVAMSHSVRIAVTRGALALSCYQERMTITKLLLASPAVATMLALAACGGSPTPANDPNASSSTGVTGNVGPASPGDPTGTANAGETKPTSGAPASPLEGKCKSGDAPAEAKDADACLKGCQGLDDTVPPGSRCISAKASCASQCRTKFKQP